MKVYTILISQNNNLRYLMSKDIVNVIKKFHGAAVMNGYNQMKYISCLVFKNGNDRDKCAEALAKRNVKFDMRDDGIVDDGLL